MLQRGNSNACFYVTQLCGVWYYLWHTCINPSAPIRGAFSSFAQGIGAFAMCDSKTRLIAIQWLCCLSHHDSCGYFSPCETPLPSLCIHVPKRSRVSFTICKRISCNERHKQFPFKCSCIDNSTFYTTICGIQKSRIACTVCVSFAVHQVIWFKIFIAIAYVCTFKLQRMCHCYREEILP